MQLLIGIPLHCKNYDYFVIISVVTYQFDSVNHVKYKNSL